MGGQALQAGSYFSIGPFLYDIRMCPWVKAYSSYFRK